MGNMPGKPGKQQDKAGEHAAAYFCNIPHLKLSVLYTCLDTNNEF
jgi:hypothetical protein